MTFKNAHNKLDEIISKEKILKLIMDEKEVEHSDITLLLARP